jgi:hypothetical protein
LMIPLYCLVLRQGNQKILTLQEILGQQTKKKCIKKIGIEKGSRLLLSFCEQTHVEETCKIIVG